MKKIICKLLGHKVSVDATYMRVREAHCERCKEKLIGAFMTGELTKEQYWVYIKK